MCWSKRHDFYAVHYSSRTISKYFAPYQDKLMMYSSCLWFLGILEWWHVWFTDCQRETSLSVWGYWTNACAFYLLCRVQRPYQTHKHLVSKCNGTYKWIPMSALLLLHLSCKQNDQIGMFDRYQYVATGWFRKTRLHCRSEAKRGSREMCLMKGPSHMLAWRQGSKRQVELWAPRHYDFCSPDMSLLRAS